MAEHGSGTLGKWLRVAAAALVLLALSEVVWLWQTWPVRELLR
jgi:HAMP domain-containing protein